MTADPSSPQSSFAPFGGFGDSPGGALVTGPFGAAPPAPPAPPMPPAPPLAPPPPHASMPAPPAYAPYPLVVAPAQGRPPGTRMRRNGWIMMLVSFLLFVTVIGIAIAKDEDGPLRRDGVAASARVVAVQVGSPNRITVDFMIGETERTATIPMDDDARIPSVGERITIHYGAADPAKATTEGADLTSPGTKVALGLLGIAAVCMLIASVVMVVVGWRVRRRYLAV